MVSQEEYYLKGWCHEMNIFFTVLKNQINTFCISADVFFKFFGELLINRNYLLTLKIVPETLHAAISILWECIQEAACDSEICSLNRFLYVYTREIDQY